MNESMEQLVHKRMEESTTELRKEKKIKKKEKRRAITLRVQLR